MQGLGYDNIGTVEMLYEPEVGFSFLEMNTRLQVEHGVTEEITGVDIVASQIRLAYGERLSDVIPLQPPRNGHAIQLRVYAEDPLRFIPSPGPLEVFRPPEMAGVRIESGFAEGDRVTPYYDPMIAKLIVHAADRPAAIRKALEAVRAFRIEGLKTNLPFLAAVLESPEFAAGAAHTGLAAEITQRMRAAA
jgi:acetyl-CoA carboxylase biotin carboxylase subunit